MIIGCSIARIDLPKLKTASYRTQAKMDRSDVASAKLSNKLGLLARTNKIREFCYKYYYHYHYYCMEKKNVHPF